MQQIASIQEIRFFFFKCMSQTAPGDKRCTAYVNTVKEGTIQDLSRQPGMSLSYDHKLLMWLLLCQILQVKHPYLFTRRIKEELEFDYVLVLQLSHNLKFTILKKKKRLDAKT
jgi:hypothetical protein